MGNDAFPIFEKNDKNGKHLSYRSENCKRLGKSQNPKEHNDSEEPQDHKRSEEYDAMRIYSLAKDKGFYDFGKIIDYQTPLAGNEKQLNLKILKQGQLKQELLGYKLPPGIHVKKMCIDLLTYNPEKNLFCVIELKEKDNQDSLLKTALEGYTYRKVLDTEELIKDLQQLKYPFEIKEKADFVVVTMFYTGSRQWKEYVDLDHQNSNVKKLMEDKEQSYSFKESE